MRLDIQVFQSDNAKENVNIGISENNLASTTKIPKNMKYTTILPDTLIFNAFLTNLLPSYIIFL